MRSFRRDASITDYKVPPGITRRIVAFARPYRALLGLFLVLIVLDAVCGTGFASRRGARRRRATRTRCHRSPGRAAPRERGTTA
jgi:predicted RNA methylase